MKRTIQVMLMALVLSSCTHVKQIGYLNIIGTRNFSFKESYVLLEKNAGAGKKNLKHHRARTIDEAVNNLVRTSQAGELLQNAKIFQLTGIFVRGIRYSIEGDIYGVK